MRLFFETSQQATCFLMAAPLGFGAALLLDGHGGGISRALADVALCVVLGLALAWLLLLLREETMRLYHVLGMCAGAAIYLGGVCRIRKWIRSKFQKNISKNA